MITYNGKEFRNLVEQVLKNQKDIESINDINRSLADYGIKIIGFYEALEDAKEDLGDPYEGPYGNAVGIGVSAPYDFYIWTRANNLSEVDYWQDVGTLAVVGPEGPQGVPGEQGEPGEPARIFTGANLPTISGTENDIYLCTSGDNNLIGNIYKIKNGTWQLQGNVRGPQGVQGPKGNDGKQGRQGPPGEPGPQGDPGGFIKIAGILDNSAQLDPPAIIRDLEVAFLVGENKELWMQVGTTYENAIWTNIGPLNVATYVSVDGQYQTIWNADTKLDKITQPLPSGNYQLYAVDDEGSQTSVELTESEDPGTIVMRGGSGEIYVPEWPVGNQEATSKIYVDSLIQDSETIATHWEGPDLYLQLNGEVIEKIERSIKTPTVAPGSAKTVPVYDRATDNVAWMGTTSWVAAANGPKFAQKTSSSWTPQALQGQAYEVFGYDINSPTFDMTITGQDGSANTISDLTYARVVMITTSWMYIQAYAGTQVKASVYAKSITSITKSKVFAIKYNSGTIT